MLEVLGIPVDLIQSIVLNFSIIATLVLLYNFVPESILSRSKLAYSLSVGVIFGLAAVISIPALWGDTESATLGFNIILVPLAGFIGGPVSTVFVAVVLLAGSLESSGSVMSSEIVSVMGGILLGALFYYARRWPRFPASYVVRYLLLGLGVVLIELSGFLIRFFQISGTAPLQGATGISVNMDVLLFFLATVCGTLILGGIITFIDRRKTAERELRDHRDHLEIEVGERTADLRKAISLQKAAFEATADGIIVVDRQGEVRAYNKKALHLLDIRLQQKEEVDSVTMERAAAAALADPAEFFRTIEVLPESAEQVVASDIVFRDGRICELFVQPQKLGDRIVGRVYSFRDITDQRHAEEAIRAANNKLVLLSDITRHDILNQMTIVSGYLELFRESVHDPAEAERVEIMRKSLEIIRLQIEFTRDYQDLGVQKPAWVNVHAAFQKEAEAFAGAVSFRSETGDLEIFSDPLIERVFYNLIDNSLRHGERITEIRFRSEQADPDLLVVYEDNGVGVVPEEKEKIFEKGFGKHTGLGMFLIREILSITGMSIRENGIPGRGVRFEIRVPRGRFRFPPLS